MADSGLRVAVTGAAGYIGSLLISRLECEASIEFILALDASPATGRHSDKVASVRQDVTEPFPDLFAEHRIETVVHLAYVLNPGRDGADARRVNVSGTAHMVEACEVAAVRHILYLSSTSVYGAHPDNADFLTEDAPIRPIPGFQYSEDKALAESLLRTSAGRLPATTVTVLRGCPVMGPNADNFIANAFRKPFLPSVGGADPPMQFVHEDDLIDALFRCIERTPPGTYNIAGDGTVRWSEMASMMDTPLIRLPAFVLYPLTSIGWRLGLQTDSPAAGLDFIRHRWTASAEKLKNALELEFRHSSREAWESFVRGRPRV